MTAGRGHAAARQTAVPVPPRAAASSMTANSTREKVHRPRAGQCCDTPRCGPVAACPSCPSEGTRGRLALGRWWPPDAGGVTIKPPFRRAVGTAAGINPSTAHQQTAHARRSLEPRHLSTDRPAPRRPAPLPPPSLCGGATPPPPPNGPDQGRRRGGAGAGRVPNRLARGRRVGRRQDAYGARRGWCRARRRRRVALLHLRWPRR